MTLFCCVTLPQVTATKDTYTLLSMVVDACMQLQQALHHKQLQQLQLQLPRALTSATPSLAKLINSSTAAHAHDALLR
jgi:hypothetical protein